MSLSKVVLACALYSTSAATESTASTCKDSTSWHKVGNTMKNCEWVARYPEKRCKVKGYEDGNTVVKKLGSEGCPEACGLCFGQNPCIDPDLGYAPLRDDLGNVQCMDADVQSGTDVTEGYEGSMDPALDPVPDYNAAGMCTVNVHWHIGAEHRSRGEYDEDQSYDHPALATYGDQTKFAGATEFDDDRRKLAAKDMRIGHMCKIGKDAFEAGESFMTKEYDWKYCEKMHVGLAYEFHWPHSSLGACQTEWQYQYPFMDGVLCGATQLGIDIATAANALMTRAHAVGVEGQVFTIVNSDDPSTSPYRRPTWDFLNGWDTTLATDRAYYQGSTTGDAVDNDLCRGTGGLVTWHQDRKCHFLEAATMDEMCRRMLVVSADDMSGDVVPHGARPTVSTNLADTPETF